MPFTSNHWNELSANQFESLVQSLLESEYKNIKPVRGVGGDKGVDCFYGEFKGKIIVFQVKFFLKTWTNTQKRNIRESLETARREHEVINWILILPLDLTPAQIEWFDKLRNEYQTIELDYWGFTRLRNLLLKHKSLRDEYFPTLVPPVVNLENSSNNNIINDIFSAFFAGGKFKEIPNTRINPYIRSEKRWIFKNKKFYLITVDSEKSAMNIASLKKYLKSDEILCIFGSSNYLDVLKGKIPMIPIPNDCDREELIKKMINFNESLVEEEDWT
ncbi:MAG: hypothetical protein ACXAC5_15170 [Promethearchaeota archaeon]|jgi:hypothetical protein